MPESKQDGYLNRFIEDDSAPETKTMAVRIYIQKHTLRDMLALQKMQGYGSLSTCIAVEMGKLYEKAKRKEEKAQEKLSSERKPERPPHSAGPIILEMEEPHGI